MSVVSHDMMIECNEVIQGGSLGGGCGSQWLVFVGLKSSVVCCDTKGSLWRSGWHAKHTHLSLAHSLSCSTAQTPEREREILLKMVAFFDAVSLRIGPFKPAKLYVKINKIFSFTHLLINTLLKSQQDYNSRQFGFWWRRLSEGKNNTNKWLEI